MLRTRAAAAAGALLRLARCGTGVDRNGAAPLARAAFSRGFLDLHKMGSKEAIEKEKARLTDEMSRGYFADIAEIRKNSGKIAEASKVIIPEVDAVKFPDLAVESPDGGGSLRLPLVAPSPEGNDHEAGSTEVPDASLVCLSFRASSQKMVESWSLPFLDAFGASKNIPIYEVPMINGSCALHYFKPYLKGKYVMFQVSFIDSWLLSSSPVRLAFLKVMRKSNNPRRHVVYAFGDHYDFRKQLQILNLLTGYIYLVDRLGRIRWRGFGSATQEELSSLTACTSSLLDEK
ncbi:hypothetical protein EJB05_33321 [Eragrostis curvula]|uniref:Uncharacterized protein n=1 Tax=Eragrostis curvula TaxID=38414 RepID=A0A5J9U2C0_9POAL|nr:hypothetical protein EJB05_33321 [Eragrostis curvula]